MGGPLGIWVILLVDWLRNRTYSGAGALRGAPTEKGAVFVRQLLFSCNISYADYAIAMVDEIEKGHHINQRISVVGA